MTEPANNFTGGRYVAGKDGKTRLAEAPTAPDPGKSARAKAATQAAAKPTAEPNPPQPRTAAKE
jgi:hypothetical protein